MSNVHNTLTGLFTDIADAIREKDGTTAPKIADAFPAAIRAIPSGGDTDIEDKLITGQFDAYENTRVNSIRANVFYGHSTLTTVSFPACTTIRSYAFYGCSMLTSISFPVCTMIDEGAFRKCVNLTTVTFPSCTTIGYQALYSCGNIISVSLPLCEIIESYAFYGCFKLLSFYIAASSVCQLLNSSAFKSTPIDGYTASTGGVYGSIFVPASLVNAYKSATNWTYFADRIAAIPEGV